ncbi:MAG TPA: hypothetical protein V6C84_14660 [Coleofasciculaceae cyanobacterium]|jgi:hypothetical protein
MPQQLQLFSETPSSQDDSTDRLLTETKLLFQHQGSNAELIERILVAAKAIKSLHEKSEVSR